MTAGFKAIFDVVASEVLQRLDSSGKIPVPHKSCVPKRLRIKSSSFRPNQQSGSFYAKFEKLQHFPFNHGSMANALPQAIGAQVAFPGRQVISFSGDGGLAMVRGDVLSLKQLKLPVKIVGFSLYLAKAVLNGRGDEVIDLARTNLFR